MQIKRNGTQPSGRGPAEYFSGSVRIDPLFEAAAPDGCECERHLRAWGAQRLAHASAGTDRDRDCRGWPDTVLGRAGCHDTTGRRHHLSGRRKALPLRHAQHNHDSQGNPGRYQARRSKASNPGRLRHGCSRGRRRSGRPHANRSRTYSRMSRWDGTAGRRPPCRGCSTLLGSAS